MVMSGARETMKIVPGYAPLTARRASSTGLSSKPGALEATRTQEYLIDSGFKPEARRAFV